jgi:RNA polymerase sigma-70 factor (ECF subfamily)
MGVLYHTALRWTQEPAEASDLVQETYLRAYRTFDSFEAGTNAKAWLLTIAYSIFVNRYRKQRREPHAVSIEDPETVVQFAIAKAIKV